MESIIEQQIRIISALQRKLLIYLDSDDQYYEKVALDVLNGHIKIASESLDIFQCLPNEIDEEDIAVIDSEP